MKASNFPDAQMGLRSKTLQVRNAEKAEFIRLQCAKSLC
jgi:hypothetical protein